MSTQKTGNINLGYVFIGTAFLAVLAQEASFLANTLWWIAGTLGALNVAFVLTVSLPVFWTLMNSNDRLKLDMKGGTSQNNWPKMVAMTALQGGLMYLLGMWYPIVAYAVSMVFLYGVSYTLRNRFAKNGLTNRHSVLL